MSEQRWFSSRVRMICLIEPEGGHDYMDSVFVFQSTDFDSAFTKALELGRKQESMYLNVENRQVVWKLKEIISLDVIDSETLNQSNKDWHRQFLSGTTVSAMKTVPEETVHAFNYRT